MKKLILVFVIVFTVFGCNKPADVKPVVPVVKDSVIVTPPPNPTTPVEIPLAIPNKLIGSWLETATYDVSLWKDKRIMFPSHSFVTNRLVNYYIQEKFNQCDYYKLNFITNRSNTTIIFDKYMHKAIQNTRPIYIKYENGNTVSYPNYGGAGSTEYITKGAKRWNDYVTDIMKDSLYSVKRDSMFWVSYNEKDFGYFESSYKNSMIISVKQK